jgi:hypothetical protein
MGIQNFHSDSVRRHRDRLIQGGSAERRLLPRTPALCKTPRLGEEIEEGRKVMIFSGDADYENVTV